MKEIKEYFGADGVFVETEEVKEYLIANTKTAFEVAKRITGKGGPIYLFGGTIRNLLLKSETSNPDYDFIGDFDLDKIQNNFPDQLIGRWDNVFTLRLKLGRDIYDFTTAKNIEDRLSNNDINISNLCMGEDGTIIDYFGGLDSLVKKEIKMINPDIKIATDPVRILRVFRFAGELGFLIEPETLSAAIKNAPLLKDAKNLDDDLYQILSLDSEKRSEILRSLNQYGIDRYFSYEFFEAIDVYRIEKELALYPQINEISRMFNSETYLVGGAVRDHIWGKKINDFDIKINLPLSKIVNILENEGFEKSFDYHTSEKQYYVSDFSGVVGAMIGGIDVHFAVIDTPDVLEMIRKGDINFSCCVFNINSKRIENPQIINEIKNKELIFCDPENAISDPLIVVNALKQISRIPDIYINEETKKVIVEGIPRIIEYFKTHPNFKYKVNSLCGNINSEEIYKYFTDEQKEIFSGINSKKEKLLISGEQYTSQTLKELSILDKEEIINLLRTAYGKKHNVTKEFPPRINSVVFEKRDGKIVSCCLIDSERIYTAAAMSGHDWMNLFTDLVKSNYNVWCTVDSNNPKIQALCSLGGLKLETNPEVMKKILVSKCNKKEEDLEIYEQNGVLVYYDKKREKYPQVLLRS